MEKLPAYTKKSVQSSLISLASLVFIKSIILSHVPVSPTSTTSYIKLIENALTSNTEITQQTAAEALGAMGQTGIPLTPKVDKWLSNLGGKATFIMRRGWATAFGYVLSGKIEEIISALCDTIERDVDVEVRRNAVQSIGLIATRQDLQALKDRVWGILSGCLDDYTVDSRGDVGSWIRIAACESMIPLLKGGGDSTVIGKLLRLSVERMDRVRVAAGKTLLSIPKDVLDGKVIQFLDGYEVWKRGVNGQDDGG